MAAKNAMVTRYLNAEISYLSINPAKNVFAPFSTAPRRVLEANSDAAFVINHTRFIPE